MGFGLPAAIGAQLAAPNKIVVDIDGDASFMMTCTELATAVQYNLPVKVLVMNNRFQGMVKQWQDLFYDERSIQTTANVVFTCSQRPHVSVGTHTPKCTIHASKHWPRRWGRGG